MKTVLSILLLLPLVAWAQLYHVSPDDLARQQSHLLLRDGSILHGRVVRQDSTVITIRKRNGDLSFIEADQVIRISSTRPVAESGLADAARSPVLYIVFVFRDGTSVEGTFVRRDSTMMTVRKRNGQLTYFEPELLSRVDSVRATTESAGEGSVKRQYVNRFSPWLLTGQTAYNAEKGKLYYRNTLLLVNELYYGITRNWSIGASVNPFYQQILAENIARQAVLGTTINFSTKLTFPIGEQFRFGINASFLPRQGSYYSTVPEQFVLQGLMSFGTSQRNATLGYGMRLFTQLINQSKQPFITAGVMHKIGNSLTFLSDNAFYLNTFFGGSLAQLSIALRVAHHRHAFDFGAVSIVEPLIYYDFYRRSTGATTAHFYPYVAYNLLIGRE